MCGIISIIKKEEDGIPTNTTISTMLTNQITRGQQGFGYVSFDDVVTAYTRRTTRTEIEAVMENNKSKSIMFHHRLPTSTPNYADCAHPIRVSHEELNHDYYVVHNGVISNDGVLRDKHIALGYEYITTIESIVKTKNHKQCACRWNDSEALAIDLARFIEGKSMEIEANGSIAFIALQVNKQTNKVMRVFYGRNSSPLTFKLTDNSLILRSEGETDSISPNVLYCLDIKTWKVESVEVPIGKIMSIGRVYSNYYDDYEDYYNARSYSRSHSTEIIRLPSPDYQPTPEEKEWIDALDAKIRLLDEQLCEAYDNKESYAQQGDSANEAKMEELIQEIEDKMDIFEEDKGMILSGQYSK